MAVRTSVAFHFLETAVPKVSLILYVWLRVCWPEYHFHKSALGGLVFKDVLTSWLARLPALYGGVRSSTKACIAPQ
ncbi:hypothetical protein EDD18DRAFT_216868 [Armillaria luteobubalina]|uniref:Uncharacterized protein n=1 Tax=Armillaria luteobubalina TaxID=153913 RepID=A0AA39U0M2_9AGAR|nr:hypothetical protein EDD18DRAFT_216868 [Armillaria luteobubalina]